MSIQVAKPTLLLSRYVKQYWAIENTLPDGIQHVQRIVPSGMTELVFYLDDKPQTTQDRKSISDSSIISGHQKDFYDLTITGRLSLFSIVFRPEGLKQFFNLPIGEFYDRNVTLNSIIGDISKEIEFKLFEAATFEEKIVEIEEFLIGRLYINYRKYPFDRMENCVRQLNFHHGDIGVDDLALEACLSRKQFERIFLDYIGASPKQFLRTVRFQHVIFMKSKKPHSNITTLAYECGFYDQAHMIHEFKKLSGMTPKQYFSECEPVSDYFEMG